MLKSYMNLKNGLKLSVLLFDFNPIESKN